MPMRVLVRVDIVIRKASRPHLGESSQRLLTT